MFIDIRMSQIQKQYIIERDHKEIKHKQHKSTTRCQELKETQTRPDLNIN